MSADAPVPLSFPAVLNNPGLLDRLRELSVNDNACPIHPVKVASKKFKRGENLGKRWARRKDNAVLVGNPHTVAPTLKDWSVTPPQHHSTFPEPLPAYLPRTVKAPSAIFPPPLDLASANAGRFTIGLKGMRRELRKSGYRTQVLVREVEHEISSWLEEGGVVLRPDSVEDVDPNSGLLIGELEAIRQIARTPLKLVWKVVDPHDAFARYIIHCCARYHQVVSYSKDVDDHRLTYLLRPNVTRPDFSAKTSLETPPTTDLDHSSYSYLDSSDLNSDHISEASESDDDHCPATAPLRTPFPGIDETNSMSEQGEPLRSQSGVDDWLVVQSGSDAEGGDEGGEFSDVDLTHSVDSLVEPSASVGVSDAVPSILERDESGQDPNETIQTTCTTTLVFHRLSRRDDMSPWNRHRSHSSPSRSPARHSSGRRFISRRNHGRSKIEPGRMRAIRGESSSFYDYLFG